MKRLPLGVVRFGLSRAEAAYMAGVSVGTFDKMVLEGALPRPRTFGARKLWLKPEIELALMELPEVGGDVGGGGDQWR